MFIYLSLRESVLRFKDKNERITKKYLLAKDMLLIKESSEEKCIDVFESHNAEYAVALVRKIN